MLERKDKSTLSGIDMEDHTRSPQFDEKNQITHPETAQELESCGSEDPNSDLSHLRNVEAHPAYLRYGIPLVLLGTLGLLLAADIGSGVAAETRVLKPNSDGEEEIFNESVLLEVSIFSSVKELWHTDSYWLAIVIVVTSILWPYVKLVLAMAAWILPNYRTAKTREKLIETIDAMGKWSFVDIFVLIVIVVAFRSNIPVAFGVSVDVAVVPRWGFYGFVLASVLSLTITHLILFLHRRVLYGSSEKAKSEEVKQSLSEITGTPPWFVLVFVLIPLGLYVAGCFVDIYYVTSERGEAFEKNYFSIVSVGMDFPESSYAGNNAGPVWIQTMYFFLGLVMPIWTNVLVCALFLVPMKPSMQRVCFFLSEMAFAWSATGALTVSTLTSVLQIPKFGNGLIESGCSQCYIMSSKLLPSFTIIALGAVSNAVVLYGLYVRSKKELYHLEE